MKRTTERNKRGLCIHYKKMREWCERCAANDQEEVTDDPEEKQRSLFG